MMDDVVDNPESREKVEMVSGVQVITNSPEAIRKILEQLNLLDLLSCQRVCKSWNFYAEKILNERQRVRTLLARKRDKSGWVSMADVFDIKSFFKDLDIRSTFVLLFGKLPLSRPCVGGNDLFSLKQLLPPSCTIIGSLSSAGIIGTCMSSGKCDEFQNPRLDCLSCMVFPKIGGLNIRYFNLTLERYEHEAFTPESANLEHLFGIPNSERVKCLVLICPSYMPHEIARNVFAAFWLRERGRIAFCGGIVEDVMEVHQNAREIQELGLTGIAFCGDDRVTAGSIIIPPQANTKSKAKSHLERYPLSMPGRKCHRFGIVFTCAARGSAMFKKKGIETELLQNQFPGTSFTGVFSLGECGINYWPLPNHRNSDNSSDEISLAHLPEVLHGFTTTVAIISVEQ